MKRLILLPIALCFFLAPKAHATISLVEATGTVSNAMSVTFNASTTAGETIFVFAGTGNANGNPINAPTDNKGDVYTQVFNATTSFDISNYSLWFSTNVPAGVTTVSSTVGTGQVVNDSEFIAAHYTGLSTVSSTILDVYNSTTSRQSSPWASGMVTTYQANELMVGGIFCWDNGGGGCRPASTTYTMTGNWKLEASTTDILGGEADALVFGDQIVSSIQTNASSTGTGGQANSIQPWIATFKSTPSTGPTPPSLKYWFNGVFRFLGNFIFL